jgi:hypothetical protein
MVAPGLGHGPKRFCFEDPKVPYPLIKKRAGSGTVRDPDPLSRGRSPAGRVTIIWGPFMFHRSQSIIALSIVAFVGGCGTSLQDIGRKIGIHGEKPSDHPEGDRGDINESLLALTAQSVSGDASAKAYEHCSQILSQGMFNTRKVGNDEVAIAKQRGFLCSHTEQSLSDFLYRYMADKSTRASNNSANAKFGMDLVEESLPVGFKFDASSQDRNSSSRDYTKEDAKSHASSFIAKYCSGSDQSSHVEKTYDMMEQIVDPGVVSAWQSCITKDQGGFFCHAEESDDQILVTLKWDPSDLARTVLPAVKLNWQTMDNLELASRDLPGHMGAGTGLPVTFRRKDETRPAALQVVAMDSGNNVNFACSRAIPAVRKGSRIEHKNCGVSLYNEGVIETRKGRGPQCGVELYKVARTAACGVEAWRKGSDMNCPGSTPPKRYYRNAESTCGGQIQESTLACIQPSHIRTGSMRIEKSWCTKMELQKTCVAGVCASAHVPVVRNRETVSYACEEPGRPQTCEAERFGAGTYKSCRHASNGVELYAECNHKDFGEIRERRPQFGVEKYNSCFVYFDER